MASPLGNRFAPLSSLADELFGDRPLEPKPLTGPPAPELDDQAAEIDAQLTNLEERKIALFKDENLQMPIREREARIKEIEDSQRRLNSQLQRRAAQLRESGERESLAERGGKGLIRAFTEAAGPEAPLVAPGITGPEPRFGGTQEDVEAEREAAIQFAEASPPVSAPEKAVEFAADITPDTVAAILTSPLATGIAGRAGAKGVSVLKGIAAGEAAQSAVLFPVDIARGRSPEEAVAAAVGGTILATLIGRGLSRAGAERLLKADPSLADQVARGAVDVQEAIDRIGGEASERLRRKPRLSAEERVRAERAGVKPQAGAPAEQRSIDRGVEPRRRERILGEGREAEERALAQRAEPRRRERLSVEERLRAQKAGIQPRAEAPPKPKLGKPVATRRADGNYDIEIRSEVPEGELILRTSNTTNRAPRNAKWSAFLRDESGSVSLGTGQTKAGAVRAYRELVSDPQFEVRKLEAKHPELSRLPRAERDAEIARIMAERQSKPLRLRKPNRAVVRSLPPTAQAAPSFEQAPRPGQGPGPTNAQRLEAARFELDQLKDPRIVRSIGEERAERLRAKALEKIERIVAESRQSGVRRSLENIGEDARILQQGIEPDVELPRVPPGGDKGEFRQAVLEATQRGSRSLPRDASPETYARLRREAQVKSTAATEELNLAKRDPARRGEVDRLTLIAEFWNARARGAEGAEKASRAGGRFGSPDDPIVSGRQAEPQALEPAAEIESAVRGLDVGTSERHQAVLSKLEELSGRNPARAEDAYHGALEAGILRSSDRIDNATKRRLGFPRALARAGEAPRQAPRPRFNVPSRPELAKAGEDVVTVDIESLFRAAREDIQRPGRRSRAKLDSARSFVRSGQNIDPPQVSVKGGKIVIDDGFHTARALQEAGVEDVPVRVSAGDSLRLKEAVSREAGEPVPTDVIGGGLAAQPGPPTGKAGNINLDRINAPEDVLQEIRRTADIHRLEARRAGRGEISLKATRELAESLGMTEEELLKRRLGRAFNAEELLAARDLNVAAARRVVDAAKALRKQNTAENFQRLAEAMDRHRLIQSQVSGVTAEAGRALSALRIPAEARKTLQSIKKIVEEAGGEKRLDELAEKLSVLDEPAQVSAFVRDAEKATRSDKLFEYWINSILSGPKTQMVNTLSNALTAALAVPERGLAAAVEAVRTVGGRRVPRERFFRELEGQALGFFQGMPEGVRAGFRAFQTEMPQFGGAASKFLDQPFAKAIEGRTGRVVRVPTRLLGAVDEFFKAVNHRMELNANAYRKAIREGLRGSGLKKRVRQLVQNPPEELMERATSEALIRTFTNEGILAKGLLSLKRGGPIRKEFRWVIPFVRTLSNIATFAAERTPVNVVSVGRAIKRGATGGEISEEVAKPLFGALVAGGFLWAISNDPDRITGGAPLDVGGVDTVGRRKTRRAAGWKPYAIKVGDSFISYDRLDPLGNILGLIADGYRASVNGDDEPLTIALDSARKNLAEQTALGDIHDLLELVFGPGSKEERLAREFRRFFGSFVPNLLNQTATGFDPRPRRPQGGFVEALGQEAQSRIPGLSRNVPARLDIFGREERFPGGALENLVNPFYRSEVSGDPVVLEMARLDVGSFEPALIDEIEKGSELDRPFRARKGRFVRNALEKLMRTTGYRRAGDAKKRELLVQEKAVAARRFHQLFRKRTGDSFQSQMNFLRQLHRESAQ